ncbi:unnamed protein product [Caenorhabditis brenneri]
MSNDNDEKSTQSPSFSDLPMEIHSQILRELDPIHRLIVRNVSKRLRLIIDNDSPRVNKIIFYPIPTRLSIGLDNKFLDFYPKNDGCQIDFENRSITLPDVAHHEMALNILRPLFLNPKLRLQNLTMWCDCDVNYLIEFLTEIVTNSLKSPFHVQHLACSITNPMKLPLITALFKPGILETIEIQGEDKYENGIMDFLETSHFKKANVVNLYRCEPLNSSVIKRFLHLTSFEIRVRYVSIEDLRWLRKIISRSTTFKKCAINLFWPVKPEEVEKAFDAVIVYENDVCEYRYSIPNSSVFLRFVIDSNMIVVDRVMQE